jgi:prepilin-type N-terminal cleavage/methylation domain-containing protein/prepilin-type processing-associated H-X9-DG protein
MAKAYSPQPSHRGGFTLVELLVVIGIIGILMGLLIPAVNAARETARRSQCASQINNLAKAAIQEEMAKKEYPGWVKFYGSNAGGGDPSDGDGGTKTYAAHGKIGTWVVSLLPYLDAQPTFEVWTQDKYPVLVTEGGTPIYTKSAAPNLAIMQCPSSSTLNSPRGLNSYIANAGMSHLPPPSQTFTFEQSMKRDNGVFNSKWGEVGPAVRADDLKDGLGNTVLFSESLQAQPWHQILPGGEAASFAALSDPAAAVGAGVHRAARFPQGFVWHWRDPKGFSSAAAPEAEILINGTPGGADLFGLTMTDANAFSVARPSSAHNGGVNMGFADGSSKFVSEQIDYRVYQAIMTPRGKSSDVPFKEYILESGAL